MKWAILHVATHIYRYFCCSSERAPLIHYITVVSSYFGRFRDKGRSKSSSMVSPLISPRFPSNNALLDTAKDLVYKSLNAKLSQKSIFLNYFFNYCCCVTKVFIVCAIQNGWISGDYNWLLSKPNLQRLRRPGDR